MFPVSNFYVIQCAGKSPLPKLLNLYPNAKDQIVSFGIKNLGTLTEESVYDFIITSIWPSATDFRVEEETAHLQYLGDSTQSKTSTGWLLNFLLLSLPVKALFFNSVGRLQSKTWYHLNLVSQAQGQENFKQLVRECACPVSVRQQCKVRIEKFASGATAYHWCTCHHLDQQEQQHQELQPAPGDTTNHAPINCLNQELKLVQWLRLRNLWKHWKGTGVSWLWQQLCQLTVERSEKDWCLEWRIRKQSWSSFWISE